MAGNIPQTGLTMLGQTLLQGSADYANRRRTQEDEARRRAERLEDVSSARQYETQNFDKVRNLQLSDEQRRRGEGLEDVKLKNALELRTNMLKEALRRGKLDASLVGNQQAEDEAIKATAAILQAEEQQKTGNVTNAKRLLAQNLADRNRVMEAIERDTAIEQRGPQLNKAELRMVQERLARRANPKKEQISEADIEQQADAALEAYQTQVLTEWAQASQERKQRLVGNHNLLQSIDANTRMYSQISGALPDVSDLALQPGTPSAQTGQQPMSAAEAAAAFKAEFEAARGKNRPPPPAGSNLTLQDVATARRNAPAASVPAMKQLQTSMLAEEIGKFDDPLLQTESELADVNGKIQRVQQGLNPLQNVTPGSLPAPDNPALAGEYMTRLLQQQAALQRKRQEQQAARQQGKGAALNSLQINTPTQSDPIFQPSPGTLLTDPFSGM